MPADTVWSPSGGLLPEPSWVRGHDELYVGVRIQTDAGAAITSVLRIQKPAELTPILSRFPV
jgi:hypothetical protein